MDKYFLNWRAQSKKKRKSKKKEQENDDLPPINFKSSKKGFNLNESLRGYRSLTDEEQNTSQHLLRVADDERDLSSVSQKRGAYQPLTKNRTKNWWTKCLATRRRRAERNQARGKEGDDRGKTTRNRLLENL